MSLVGTQPQTSLMCPPQIMLTAEGLLLTCALNVRRSNLFDLLHVQLIAPKDGRDAAEGREGVSDKQADRIGKHASHAEQDGDREETVIQSS